ncbi:MAG: SRPBCC domain-containing protein [Pseudomonadota bacterium]
MNAPVNVGGPELAIRRTYTATSAEVFAALSQAEALAEWFSPYPGEVIAETDLRVGGKWSIQMAQPDDEPAKVSGEYLEIVNGKRLAFTWAWAGTPDRVSKVVIDLVDQGGTTLLTLTHTQFFDETARDRHKLGWGACLEKLGPYLEARAHREIS